MKMGKLLKFLVYDTRKPPPLLSIWDRFFLYKRGTILKFVHPDYGLILLFECVIVAGGIVVTIPLVER